MNRWYDTHQKLAENIDLMKGMRGADRDRLLQGILKIIKQVNPTLLEDFALEFPMDMYQKRWYDKDPYLWITVNGLSFGTSELLDSVAAWLEKEHKKVLTHA